MGEHKGGGGGAQSLKFWLRGANFMIQFLGETEREFENILTCLFDAQKGSNHKRVRKFRDTRPLTFVC